MFVLGSQEAPVEEENAVGIYKSTYSVSLYSRSLSREGTVDSRRDTDISDISVEYNGCKGHLALVDRIVWQKGVPMRGELY